MHDELTSKQHLTFCINSYAIFKSCKTKGVSGTFAINISLDLNWDKPGAILINDVEVNDDTVDVDDVDDGSFINLKSLRDLLERNDSHKTRSNISGGIPRSDY